MTKVVIIGGMASGCKTAARLKRIKPEFEVTIVEKLPFISFGTCGMPFFASGDIDSFDELMRTPWGALRDVEFFKEVKGVNVLVNTEAKSINHSERNIACRNNTTNEEFTLKYDKLVIATGAVPAKPNIKFSPSQNILTFHSPLDAKTCRELAQKGKIEKAAIIGGGYIGCELAEALSSLWGIDTTIIEIEKRLLPRSLDAEISFLLEKNFLANGVNVSLGRKVIQIDHNEAGELLLFADGSSFEASHIFLCAGVRPKVSLAEEIGCDIGSCGGIIVDEQMRTSVSDVWAVGDCVEIKHCVTGKYSHFPLGSIANRMGRTAANSIAGISGDLIKGASGAVSTKIFGLAIASSGLNLATALQEGFSAKAIWGSWLDRPDYMPGAKSLFGELVYDISNMRLLGLQLAGSVEATRYLDAFSVYIANNAAVYDLLSAEHCYTPPHSSPMNPLNYLGAIAFETDRLGIDCVSPRQLNEFNGIVIDVREEEEISADIISRQTISIPLSNIRSMLKTFNKAKSYIVVCQRGPRSYEAAVILKNHGFANPAFIGGGASFINGTLDLEED